MINNFHDHFPCYLCTLCTLWTYKLGLSPYKYILYVRVWDSETLYTYIVLFSTLIWVAYTQYTKARLGVVGNPQFRFKKSGSDRFTVQGDIKAFWIILLQRAQTIVLYCMVLYCTVLYCTVLYCTVLYCTVLYCTVPLKALSD